MQKTIQGRQYAILEASSRLLCAQIFTFPRGIVGGTFICATLFVAHSNFDRKPEANYWLARINADRRRLDSAEYHAFLSSSEYPGARDTVDGVAITGPSIPPHEFTDDALYLRAWILEGREQIEKHFQLE